MDYTALLLYFLFAVMFQDINLCSFFFIWVAIYLEEHSEWVTNLYFDFKVIDLKDEMRGATKLPEYSFCSLNYISNKVWFTSVFMV